jgi:hypothetical protein
VFGCLAWVYVFLSLKALLIEAYKINLINKLIQENDTQWFQFKSMEKYLPVWQSGGKYPTLHPCGQCPFMELQTASWAQYWPQGVKHLSP